MTRIGIVIPTRNRSEHLRRALTSVRTQRRLPDEVIVVDDGSDEPVDAGIFEGFPLEVSTHLLRNDKAMGANRSRNAGIAEASSDYIAFLDDDDEFHEDKIAMIGDVLETGSPDIVHHCAEIIYDNEGVSYRSKLNRDVTFQSLLLGNKVGSTSLGCVRRQLLCAIDGFDPDLPALQDWDLWLRAARAGASFHGIDKPLTRYHFITGEAAISKSADRLKHALASVDAKCARELEGLSPAERRQRRRTDVMRYAHRYAMSDERWAAARTYLAGAMETRSVDFLFAAPVALLGVKYLAALRARRRS